jgi:dipeptidase E
MKRNLLLISNSTNVGEAYLSWPRPFISDFLKQGVKRILFVPYAGVNLSDKGLQASFDVYEQKVASVFAELGYEIYSIHRESDPVKAVNEAECIAVGGGNTFHLVYMLHREGLVEPVRRRIAEGMPFMGWSAGANVACPTLRTTNDMPIIEPASFNCFNVVPFQINPHYLDAHPEGHGGETREQRINEFLEINPEVYVVGLREASLLEVHNDTMQIKGRHGIRLFKRAEAAREIALYEDVSFLLK